jgi:hypothetical protein
MLKADPATSAIPIIALPACAAAADQQAAGVKSVPPGEPRA